MSWLKSLVGLAMPVWLMPIIIAIGLAVLTGGAYYKGKLNERADWVSKENAELVQRQKTIINLTEKNRALESLRAVETANLNDFYERKLQDEKTNANAVIADLRAGAKRLRIGIKAVPACNGGVSLTTADRSQPATETRAELSAAAGEFLIRFATDANEAVIEGNHVKDLLTQCRTHVGDLRAQNIGANASGILNDTQSSLTTTLQLNSQPKEISND